MQRPTRPVSAALAGALVVLATLTTSTLAASPSVTVAITSPAPAATVFGIITVAGTARSTKFPIASVALAVDAGGYANASLGANSTWTFALATDTLANGVHRLTARALDSHGNSATSSETVTVNNLPPTVSIATPQAGATVSGLITVAGSASSQAGITAVSVAVDANAASTATGTTSWSLAIDTTAYANGSHKISVTAVDSLGRAASGSITVTVSNPFLRTYPSPWYLQDATGGVSVVNDTMTWDGAANQGSALPSGTLTFSVNSAIAPNDTAPGDSCAADPTSGDWSCTHVIQAADLQWNSVLGWSLHYAFQLGVDYPASSTFTIGYSGDSIFLPSSAVAANT